MARAADRARTVVHAEYEILNEVLRNTDFGAVEGRMVDDDVTQKRFVTAAKNVAGLINNLITRRLHRLPETHPDYTPKED